MQPVTLISYSFRIDQALMTQANAIAAANDEKMAQVLRKAIRDYVKERRKKEVRETLSA